jgi:protein-L-isoaspartate(D-aspartate) O-methyltransferase
MFAAGIRDRRVETAFAAVPRQHFLGRGPWPILRWNRGYVPTPSRNPVYIYDDVLIGIVPERHLNNGQPWLHVLLIASAAPKVGYYSAILAHLVGRRGRPLLSSTIRFKPAARAAACAIKSARAARSLMYSTAVIPLARSMRVRTRGSYSVPRRSSSSLRQA